MKIKKFNEINQFEENISFDFVEQDTTVRELELVYNGGICIYVRLIDDIENINVHVSLDDLEKLKKYYPNLKTEKEGEKYFILDDNFNDMIHDDVIEYFNSEL